MNGFQITFYMQQKRLHHGKTIADWLVHLVGELGLRGATVIPASEGIDHHHRIHSSHFFELADQPISVVMIVNEEENKLIFERLQQEGVHLFYSKVPVEFGVIGKEV